MGRMLPVRLVRRQLCLARLSMYSTERWQLWLDMLFVNDSGRYWYWTIAQILSPVQVRGDAACLIWSRCHKAMCRKSFRINWYAWRNLVTMWLCIRVNSMLPLSCALSCMCTYQYLEFWGKLFWSLLYPSNVMCYMHCMIVLAILAWTNDQYEAKICTLWSFR